jgi:hypothetical protein
LAKTSFCLLVLAALTFACASAATAQDAGFRVESLSVGSGQSATTSGLTAILTLSNAKGAQVEVWAMQEMAMFLAGRSFKVDKATILTAGFVTLFEEALAVGPRIGINVPIGELAGQKVSLDFLEWPGVFPGRAPKSYLDHDLDNLKLMWLQMAQVNIGGLGLSYSNLKFLDEPTNHLPGAVYTQSMGKNVSVTSSVVWNGNKSLPMYYIGAIWHPGR